MDIIESIRPQHHLRGLHFAVWIIVAILATAYGMKWWQSRLIGESAVAPIRYGDGIIIYSTASATPVAILPGDQRRGNRWP